MRNTLHFYIGVFALLLASLFSQAFGQSCLSSEEDYSFRGDWEHILQVPEYNGNLLLHYGGIVVENGAVQFQDAGCRSDKRVYRTLGYTLGSTWDAEVEFTPTGGGPHGTGAAILAFTAGTQDMYKIVPEVVSSPNPSFVDTDQDGVFAEYVSPNYGAPSTYYLRLSVKVGTTRVVSSTHLLVPNTGTYQVKVSRLSDRFRLEIWQGGSLDGALEILNSSLTAGLPTGLHVVQHGVISQGGYNRRLTATVDNLTIEDPTQPCIWCPGVDWKVEADVSRNRIISETIKIPVLNEAHIDNVNVISSGGDKVLQVAYFDGLGRPDQTIDVQAAPDCGDMISYHLYDTYGRESIKDLPYVDQTSSASYRSSSQSDQGGFYVSSYSHLSSPERFYPDIHTQFEASPLNRIIEQGAPGLTWRPDAGTPGVQTSNEHTITTARRANMVADGVMRFPHDGSVLTGTTYHTQVYGAGSLMLVETRDENGNLQQVFTDKFGRTVLQRNQFSTGWAATYTVYDSWGRVRYVFQPELSAQLAAATSLSASMLDEGAFQYVYDKRGRVIEKRVPGADWVYLVYDGRDRVIVSQDGRQRQQGQWLFTKYDAQDRPIMTGIFSSSASRSTVQFDYDSNSSLGYFEVRQSGTTHGYTTNQSYPTHSLTIHSVSYYDDYDFDANGTADYSYVADPDFFPNEGATDRLRGKITGVKTAILDPEPGMPNWLWTVTFYDDRDREIQTLADNHLGGKDTTDYAYNFAGELLMSRHSHAGHDGTGSYGAYERNLRTWRYNHYDQRGRLIRTEIRSEDPTQVNASTGRVVLSNQDYDPLGQLSTKKLHNDGSGNFWQEVDYLYNLRGWLTRINSIPTNTGQAPSAVGDDLFSLRLYYDETSGLTGATPQYNGNIAAAYWWSETKAMENTAGSDEYVKGFIYDYDVLNRLTASTYSHSNAFGTSYSYDLNGNIETLDRNVPHQSLNDQAVSLDDLTYTYQGNRLLRVDDASSFASSGISQFQDGTNTGDDYSYDASGNLVGDLNRSITLSYNHLNKPTEILFASGSKLTYIYSADGTKLRQIQQDGGACLRKQTDYVGSLVYEDPDGIGTGVNCNGGGGSQEIDSSDVYLHALKQVLSNAALISDSLQTSPQPIYPLALQLIQRGITQLQSVLTTNEPFALAYLMHEEGRLRRSGTELVFEYYLKDHLGNTRVMFGDNDGDGTPEALQEDHYYPFGLQLADEGLQAAAPAIHLYNGKELQDELGLGWYDYGARMLNPAIGRWNGVDALSEDYLAWSPYNYVFNNPLKFTDPTGMAPMTDYYNKKGKLVKKVNDGSKEKVLVLTASKNPEKVNRAINAGQVAPVASEDALNMMDDAYAITEKTGKEAGFAVATDGTTSTMAKDGSAGKVDVVSKRSELIKKGKTVAYDVHTHPNKPNKNQYGAPTPSGADMTGLPSSLDSQNSVVLGYTAREVEKPGQGTQFGQKETEIQITRTIGFYNNNGSTGTMDYERYKKVVRKINGNGK